MRILKEMLDEQDTVFGCFQFILDPDVTELIGQAGLDFVVLDTEHSARGIDAVRLCILAAHSVDLPAVVRVAECQQFLVEQALDAGAQGVLVPTLETREEALHLARSARFAPEGERGFCPTLANRRWLQNPAMDSFTGLTNRSVVVGALVETPKGLDNLDDMLTVDGIDAWMIGPGDLSVRLGLPNSDSRVDEMVAGGIKKVNEAGKVAWASSAGGSKDIGMLRGLGARMIMLAPDVASLGAAMRSAVSSATQALANRDTVVSSAVESAPQVQAGRRPSND